MEDDFDDSNILKFVTDSDSTDQDSLDEKIDLEQRLRNHQLWASFQLTASCITKLYNDKAQSPNPSPWVPFQNAASNLATLYKDCIESQRKFAKIGYQHGRRRKLGELKKLLIKHKLPTKVLQKLTTAQDNNNSPQSDSMLTNVATVGQNNHPEPTISSFGQQHNTNVSSILNVNELNLGNDDITSVSANNRQSQSSDHYQLAHQLNHHQQQILLGNNEDDLSTFQQALSQPALSSGRIKISNQMQHQQHQFGNRRSSSGYINNNRNLVNDPKSEEERLFELNQFLTEEYHRHVGSRKRSCSSLGGDAIKRHRE